MFLIYINGLLFGREKCSKLGVKFSKKQTVRCSICQLVCRSIVETKSTLRKLIDIVHYYSKHSHFETNVKKRALLCFFQKWAKFLVGGFGVMKAFLFWIVLGIEFSSDG